MISSLPRLDYTTGAIQNTSSGLTCNLGGATDISGVEAHIAVFGVLALLIVRALAWRRQPTTGHLVAAFALTALFAASDELHQMFVPGRGCELVDFWMDLLGAVLGLVVYVMAWRLRHPEADSPST